MAEDDVPGDHDGRERKHDAAQYHAESNTTASPSEDRQRVGDRHAGDQRPGDGGRGDDGAVAEVQPEGDVLQSLVVVPEYRVARQDPGRALENLIVGLERAAEHPDERHDESQGDDETTGALEDPG